MQFLQVEMPKFQDKMLEFSSGFHHFQLPRIGSFPIGKARKPRNPRNTGHTRHLPRCNTGASGSSKNFVVNSRSESSSWAARRASTASNHRASFSNEFWGSSPGSPFNQSWQIITWFLVGELVQKLCCLLNRLCQSTVNPVMSFKAWPV